MGIEPFSNGIGCHMSSESLEGFREIGTHLKARDSCHVWTFLGQGVTTWPIFHSRKKEEDLNKELELDIKRAKKPSIWELIVVRFILLPYTIGKVRIPTVKLRIAAISY